MKMTMKEHDKTLADYYADVVRRISEQAAIEGYGSEMMVTLHPPKQKTEADIIYNLHNRGALCITDNSQDTITLIALPELQRLLTPTNRDIKSTRDLATIDYALPRPSDERKTSPVMQSSGNASIKYRDEPPKPKQKLGWKDTYYQPGHAVFERTADNKGALKIVGYQSLSFENIPADIVEFFCALPHPDSKKPRTYGDLPTRIRDKCNSERYRKAIAEINKRFRRHTEEKFGDLIHRVKKEPGYNEANEYYWGL